ncbi:MAG TPA: hypothetical protein VK843_02905 [Planctomycetota bacterium]|nr:hypothetical protein [Planctomycetota bacterium]
MARTEDERARDRKLLWGACFFVALLPILFHLPYVSGERILYTADTAQLQYPRYKILCDALQKEGQLPLWQTWLYAGSPFHANPENPTLYPPVLLFARFFTPIWTINLTILTHLSLAALGMFLLVRRLWKRVDVESGSGAVAIGGAMVAACVFSLSMWTRIDHLNFVAYGATHALIPWVLLATEALLDGPRPLRAAGCLGLLLGFQIQTGGLFVIPYAAISVAAWILFLGLLGGRARALRVVSFGLLAALTAALIVGGKFLPYREWVAVTNRAAVLDYSEAVGKTFSTGSMGYWDEVLGRVIMFTFFGTTIALALLALPLLRSGVVRLAFGLVICFFLVALGTPLHRFLYDYLPLFDHVRNADRAWSGVNAFLPILAGLGMCWVLSRFARLRERPLAASIAGGVLAAMLAPLLAYSFRFEPVLKHPERFSELLSRYTQWPEAARRAGTEWRAMYVDRTTPENRNEQFISTALEVETPAGYLGHVWPRDLEQHLYGSSAKLTDVQRFRRRSTLSVRYLVSTTKAPGRPPAREDIFPQFADGDDVIENALARQRAVEPSVVAAVYGDDDCKVAYAILDEGTTPLLECATLQLRADRELSADERAGIDLLILRGPSSPEARQTVGAMRADGKGERVIEISAEVSDEEQARVLLLVHDKLAIDALKLEPSIDRLTRRASDSTLVERSDAARGRWLVVSEPWSIYAGWNVVAASGASLSIARADGISSAVFLPAGEKSLHAEYAPESVKTGLWLFAAGVIAGLLLILWPARPR